MFQRLRTYVPTARRLIAAHWGHFLDGRRRAASGTGQGQVRRLPADAARRPRRGVPHRDQRAALRLGLHRRGTGGREPRIVSPSHDGSRWRSATSSTGWACRRWCTTPTARSAERSWPGSEASRPGSRWWSGGTATPTRSARCATSRCRSTAAPTTSTSTPWSTSWSSAPGRPAWPPSVYGASEGLTTVIVEAEAIGGQAGTSSMIRNYLGFPRGISGMRLAQRARNQAIRFGTRFFTGWEVDGARGRPRRRAPRPTHRGRRRPCPGGGDRVRRGLPQARRRVGRGAGRPRASTTAPR